MRWLLVVVAMFVPACSCNNQNAGPDATACNPPTPCTNGDVCRYDTCVAPPIPCSTSADCPGDSYCELSTSECLPWGVGPGGGSDPECKREPVPGVFFPGAQCEWLAPPAGDPFQDHRNVLAMPMVATFYKQGEFAVPSIVFTSYNFTDGGAESCQGTNPLYYGVIRVIDGRNCTQQANLPPPTVVASASVAIADLGGSDPTPEIVAARTIGGLVAFTLKPTGWEVLWQTTSVFADTLCNWAGPSIHDLDDDGKPEILFYGAVYDGATGATIDESIAGTVDAVGVGYIPVVADVDGDGSPELVTGSQLYSWDRTARRWVVKQASPGGNGHTAVADFGTFPMVGTDDRATKDGVPEVAVISAGIAKVFNIHGRELFTGGLTAVNGAVFPGTGLPAIGHGGPPTIADFDGDGRVEFASAGASGYHVFDLDCRGTPDPASCPSMRADGIAWLQQSQDFSSNTTGSSVFDFDGDARAEVIYGDECFTRVYDGISGKVLYSRYRTSCTWYETPVIADVDADFNAEIISTSNTNCSVSCPLIDPIFDGVQCLDDSDCPSSAPCRRDAPSDALGRCRCSVEADCGGDGFVCIDPMAGPAAAGKVCRASHPATVAATGVRVLADTVDRWVNTRPIWNQHAYSVTNIDGTGSVPRTSMWASNWTQPELNNYRANAPGEGVTAGAIPDLTVKQAKVTCDASGATVTAEVCNRGTEPVAPGLPVAVYDDSAPPVLKCVGMTSERIFPGICTNVSCLWTGAGGEGQVTVDDRGNSTGTNLECREDNNTLPITVGCQ
ncbi:MAG: VCBS repeat-containing protein [Deltaproteobacteria bacterium]|nr:VCBS repeat-containing protein [Deltaproteobacteria bacterium]